MNKAIVLASLAALLSACGGGGSGAPAVVQAAPVAVAPVAAAQAPKYADPACRQMHDHIACDLTATGDEPTGVTVPAGAVVMFTNRTGAPLQVDRIDAFTGNKEFLSEYCAYLEMGGTEQSIAGLGEVGCSIKNIGEDYQGITWGTWSGLLIQPGQFIGLNSHTEPEASVHTYTLRVRAAQTALNSWRQPRVDEVIPCNGGLQSTQWAPWRNDTGRILRVYGVDVYATTGDPAKPNELNGDACIQVLDASGNTKWANCDRALTRRGNVDWPAVEIQPGEYIVGQAVNTCSAPRHWDWAAWLRIA